MCCDNSGENGEPNGECPQCGQDTVDGSTTDHCNYSSEECTLCGWAPCDLSC